MLVSFRVKKTKSLAGSPNPKATRTIVASAWLARDCNLTGFLEISFIRYLKQRLESRLAWDLACVFCKLLHSYIEVCLQTLRSIAIRCDCRQDSLLRWANHAPTLHPPWAQLSFRDGENEMASFCEKTAVPGCLKYQTDYTPQIRPRHPILVHLSNQHLNKHNFKIWDTHFELWCL